MTTRTINGQVATYPMATHGIQAKTLSSGLVTASNYTDLMKLEVAANGPDGIEAGDFVYVSGKYSNVAWAKEVLERTLADGTKQRFILIPVQFISMVETHR